MYDTSRVRGKPLYSTTRTTDIKMTEYHLVSYLSTSVTRPPAVSIINLLVYQ